MKQRFEINREEDTILLAEKVAPLLTKGQLIALYGDLGTGKTFFTRYICRALGVGDLVTSPSFVLLNQYEASQFMIYHLDLYRLYSVEDVLSLGLDDFIEEGVTFIEWPLLAESYFNRGTIKFFFLYEKGERSVTIEADEQTIEKINRAIN